MATFITPFSGTAELTASTGLNIIDQGSWRFSQSGYNDGATFGVSLTGPSVGAPGAPVAAPESGLLHLQALNWTISNIGNQLTEVDDNGTIIPASRCRISVTGQWQVLRQPNSNSFNSTGVIYRGSTETDQGSRDMDVFLLNLKTTPVVSYVIQGTEVEGGALDTFSTHVFYCKVTEIASTQNTNKEFQSNSTVRPAGKYTYSKSWQID